MNKIKKLTLKLALLAAVLFGAVVTDAQQTNLQTSATGLTPYYSISNYYGINASQILFGDTFGAANPYLNTNLYYTNVTSTPTNQTTGAQVGLMGAAKSLNVGFTLSFTLTNAAYSTGTNTIATAYVDASTGFGDWVPSFFNITGTANTNNVPTVLGGTTHVGGYTIFRVNRISFNTTGAGTIVPGGTNVCFQYSTKTGL